VKGNSSKTREQLLSDELSPRNLTAEGVKYQRNVELSPFQKTDPSAQNVFGRTNSEDEEESEDPDNNLEIQFDADIERYRRESHTNTKTMPTESQPDEMANEKMYHTSVSNDDKIEKTDDNSQSNIKSSAFGPYEDEEETKEEELPFGKANSTSDNPISEVESNRESYPQDELAHTDHQPKVLVNRPMDSRADHSLSQIEELDSEDAYSNNIARKTTSAPFERYSIDSMSVSPNNHSDNVSPARKPECKNLRKSISSANNSSVNYGAYKPRIVDDIETMDTEFTGFLDMIYS
jgi:hypothetical protein